MLVAIDPGSNTLGWATFNSASLLIAAGSVIADKGDRYDRTDSIIKKLSLQVDFNESMACEEPMLRGKANKVMERLLGWLEANCKKKVKYYAPTAVKKAMGHGTFDKSLVKAGVLRLLSESEREIIKGRLHDSDMTDAIAVGLLHLGRINHVVESKKKKKSKRLY